MQKTYIIEFILKKFHEDFSTFDEYVMQNQNFAEKLKKQNIIKDLSKML